jgi:hypothetical protein
MRRCRELNSGGSSRALKIVAAAGAADVKNHVTFSKYVTVHFI